MSSGPFTMSAFAVEGDLVNEAVEALVAVCHGRAHKAGWWHDLESGIEFTNWTEREQRGFVAEKLLLVHSEVSEGVEGFRKGRNDDHLPHRPQLEVELADAVIRIADLCGGLGLDLGGAVAEKLAYNAQRADHKPEARVAAGGKSF